MTEPRPLSVAQKAIHAKRGLDSNAVDEALTALQNVVVSLEVPELAARDEAICHCALVTANLAARIFHRFHLAIPRSPCPPHPLVQEATLDAAVRQMIREVNPDAVFEEAGSESTQVIFGGAGPPHSITVDLSGWNVYIHESTVPGPPGPRGANPAAIVAAAAFATDKLLRQARPEMFGRPAGPISLNLFDYGQAGPRGPVIDPNLGTLHLVGVGSLGTSVLYCFGLLRGATGEIHAIDPDTTKVENLAFYPLLLPKHLDKPKPDWAAEILTIVGSSVKIVPYAMTVEDFGRMPNVPPISHMIIVPDNVPARLAASDLLPRTAVTATAQGFQGTIFHCHFAATFCPYCPYVATQPEEKRQITIARLTGLRLERVLRLTARFVKGRSFAPGQPEQPDGIVEELTEADVTVLENATKSTRGSLHEWVGRHLEDFYRTFMGRLYAEVPMGRNDKPEELALVTLPMAHVSALTGALTFAEFMKEKAGACDRSYGFVTIDVATGGAAKFPKVRDPSQRCVCWDTRRQRWYLEMWPESADDFKGWTTVGGRLERSP